MLDEQTQLTRSVVARRHGRRRRMRALVRKELLQLVRDRRTLALMLGMPLILLVIFGYGIRFDVSGIGVELVSHDSAIVRGALAREGHFQVLTRIAADEGAARSDLKHGRASLAIVVATTGLPTKAVVDGSDSYTAQATERYLRALATSATGQAVPVEVLFNAQLRSADYMIPAMVGTIMLWIGTIATALGVARERERGTLEQLVITPIGRVELMIGKLVPNSLVALFDAVMITVLGVVLFHVPLRGNPILLVVLMLPYLIAVLALGLIVSTVAQNQRQAQQAATFILLPQVLLSGVLFPLGAIPWGIRWVSQLMPLTYFTPIIRGVFLKGLGFADLWRDAMVLVAMAITFTLVAALSFRTTLD